MCVPLFDDSGAVMGAIQCVNRRRPVAVVKAQPKGRAAASVSGDAIYDSDLIDDLPDSDRVAYCRTMQRLLELPIRLGHGGHGPSFDRGRMRDIAARYLEDTEALG